MPWEPRRLVATLLSTPFTPELELPLFSQVWVRAERLLKEVVGSAPAFLDKTSPSAPPLPPTGIFHGKVETLILLLGTNSMG